ncbi:DUF6586 family protein [Microbulbifer elongatus]|uniref:DUF6586 family protein n=1 Tax=Microbulbifer elongatus TaxID=86173 RepID=UPI001E2E18B7|nr:DUF6586 family protein [Microbulbifer elongatus]
MSNPYTGTVASALRKAQLLLQSSAQAGDTPLLEASLLEAAVVQLWRGYRGFLAEQGHQMQLGFATGAEPETAHALAHLVAQRGKFSAEANELVSLAENPDSWFAGLCGAWHRLWALSVSSATTSSPASGVQSVIPVRQLDDLGRSVATSDQPLTRERVQEWYQGLSELIQRQRAHSQEW